MDTLTNDQPNMPILSSSPINVNDYTQENLLKYLNDMLVIRIVEQKLAEKRRDGDIGGPVHLGVGQEAIAVGVSSCLKPTDRVFGAHRSHAHLLALGGSPYKLFAEVLGKDTGCSRGMGGSMHLWDANIGFYGSVPIVAGTVPLAVGAALAAKIQNTKDIAVSYLGDGAIEEGVVHESMNLARIYNLPIIFVLENNFFASHMHISQRQPSNYTARFARANNIPYEVLDGNDVVGISKVMNVQVEAARRGGGPFFIEALTYRWYGHVDWRLDVDVGVNRSHQDIDLWKNRDPIKRLSEALMLIGIWSNSQQSELEEKIKSEIENAWNQAILDPYPNPQSLLHHVYYNG